MYRSKVVYVFKNGIFQSERLTITTPGSVLHMYLSTHYTVSSTEGYDTDITDGMNGLHSILAMNFIQDY